MGLLCPVLRDDGNNPETAVVRAERSRYFVQSLRQVTYDPPLWFRYFRFTQK